MRSDTEHLPILTLDGLAARRSKRGGNQAKSERQQVAGRSCLKCTADMRQARRAVGINCRQEQAMWRLIFFLCLVPWSSGFAQDDKQTAIDSAITAAERVCLVGSRYK